MHRTKSCFIRQKERTAEVRRCKVRMYLLFVCLQMTALPLLQWHQSRVLLPGLQRRDRHQWFLILSQSADAQGKLWCDTAAASWRIKYCLVTWVKTLFFSDKVVIAFEKMQMSSFCQSFHMAAGVNMPCRRDLLSFGSPYNNLIPPCRCCRVLGHSLYVAPVKLPHLK